MGRLEEDARSETCSGDGLFRCFAEASGQCLGMAALTGRIIYVNPCMARLLGVSNQTDLYLSSIFTLYHAATVERLRAEIIPAVLQGGQWTGEIEIVNRLGRDIACIQNIFLIRDESGQPHCFGTICIDISARRQLENELACDRDQLEALAAQRTLELQASNDSLLERIAEHQRAEEQLARQAAILDSTSDLVATAFPAGQLLYLNAAGYRLLGRSTDQGLAGFDMSQTHPAWAWQIVHAEGLPAAARDGLWQGETAILNAAGQEIPVSQVIMAHRDAKGQIEFFSTIMRDVSERKRSEQNLRDWMQRYDFLVEASGQVVYDYLIASQAILWGHNLEKVLGYSLAEMSGGFAQWTELLHPEDRAKTLAVLEAAEQACGFLDDNYRLRHRDGHYVWLRDRGYFLPGPDGRAERQLGLIEDISERKQIEQAMRESEEKFRLIFELAPISVAINDSAGRYLDVNAKMCERAGVARDRLIGRSYGEVPEMARFASEEEGRAVQQKLRTLGRLDGDEIHLLRPSNGERSVNLLFTRQVTLGGQPCTISMLLDITERKHLENQLLQAQKMESIGRLAGGVAHDFNNLLTAISGNAELALMLAEQNPRLSGHLNEIQQAATSAAELTKQLLTFSRKQIVELKVVDLNELLWATSKMLSRVIGEDIRLRTVAQPGLNHVLADPGQLQQIIMNLAVNARDAMPEGGILTIETANTVLDEAYCQQYGDVVPGDYVMLAVCDTGCGMSPEVKEHIFEPFFTTKAVGQGTGLGLATVYGAVKQNSGIINIYSEPGQGSCFRVYLPRTASPELPQAQEASAKSMPGGNETILLVEDDPRVRTFACKALERLGYRVLSAASGEEALELARTHAGPLDLLLTDVVMPGLNGRQTADRLLVERPGLKVLFASGYTQDAIVQHGVLDQGINFIGKPYGAQSLAVKLREILDQA